MLAAELAQLPLTEESPSRTVRAVWSRANADAVAAATMLRQVRCGFGGHLMVRHYEPGRLCLECVGCGKQTHGWTIHVE